MGNSLIAAIAAAFALGVATGWWFTDAAADIRVATAHSARDKAIAEAVLLSQRLVEQRGAMDAAARKSAEDQRAIEQQRQAAHDQEIAYVRTQLATQMRSARTLRGIVDKLRDHIAALAAGAGAGGPHPDLAIGSTSAAGPGLVLTDVCGGAVTRAADLAVAYDAAAAAGRACERIHDGLTWARP